MPLSDRRPAPTAGQPLTDAEAETEAHRIIRQALQQEPKPTAYRDDTPLPVTGTAPPVPQPGRPPMSQGATDASTLMLAGGATTLMVGGGASLVMLASGYADPVVCAIVLGAPAVVALAIGRVLKRAKDVAAVASPTVHQHYNGTVHQDSRSTVSHTQGVFANTRNQNPR
ncbi:hypothetical protein [Streptomyces sp. NPDC058155]|uniref:hypothetical protein n=1 Tax=Streptomyces sp. NPDC058155 TaxID=3346359 RepID=UPI0036E11EA8